MSEKQKKEINQQLYEKFFIELKKKHNTQLCKNY